MRSWRFLRWHQLNALNLEGEAAIGDFYTS